MHISNIKRTIGLEKKNKIKHQERSVDAGAKRSEIIKTTPLTGHHAAEDYNLNT